MTRDARATIRALAVIWVFVLGILAYSVGYSSAQEADVPCVWPTDAPSAPAYWEWHEEPTEPLPCPESYTVMVTSRIAAVNTLGFGLVVLLGAAQLFATLYARRS